MYHLLRDSYDRIAERYAVELGGELAGKPVDRALLRCFVDVVEALDEGADTVADLGCGPGHIAAHLTGLGVPTVGVDISPGMVEVGRRHYPQVQFRLGTLLAIPAADGELTGAVAFYSIIHLRPDDRPLAYREMARVIKPGGWLLVAFHVGLVGQENGGIMHVEQWWGERVDLDFYHLDPGPVVAGLTEVGFVVMSRTDREPWPGVEHESRRCYLLCRRS